MSKSRRKARVSQKERLRRLYQSHTAKGRYQYSDGEPEYDPDEEYIPPPPLRMTMDKKNTLIIDEEDDVV